MRSIKASWVALCVLLSSAAEGIAQEKMVAVWGAGQQSCGSWLSARSAPQAGSTALINQNWVLGYITAFNVYALKVTDDVAGPVDQRGLHAWIDNYCRTNPLDTIQQATTSLIGELRVRHKVE